MFFVDTRELIFYNELVFVERIVGQSPVPIAQVYWHDGFCHKNDTGYVVICEVEEGGIAVAMPTDDNEADGGIGVGVW